jgi:DNA-binding IscR family transcriptional regulator
MISLLRPPRVAPVAGGWELTAKPSALTLAQVFRLFASGSVFALHSRHPNPRCPVGKGIQRALSIHYQQAQAALEKALAAHTIADLLQEVTRAE